jgi:hypothetical protein
MTGDREGFASLLDIPTTTGLNFGGQAGTFTGSPASVLAIP